jgi:hypothetical protein
MSLDTQLTLFMEGSDAEKRGVKMRLSKDVAARILSDVSQDKAFWLCDNRQLKNLKELSAALADMSPEVYRYHVNKEKNDFANWIAGAIGDEKLAEDILKSKSQASLAEKIAKRLTQLSKK